ncbi:MAG: 2-succinyl-5-enolpyruvyl-6-hydroxy-3-cyclohexene-1-carboxylic-acid synthase [Clostridia bacterium]|nr:2-succinyl-5-enolpyruvyl-6-hydroxy-3-cyclohexene-1-carboxylic-acid synthase [Clostridia bacterium]
MAGLGIKEAVLSPGSRSTPLAMWFCQHSQIKTYLNIDERSAAFLALGIAKEQERPVVLVCTSGSAAAHYLPAVTEAKHSRIPLLILTADRPAELQNVGAAQTINQTRILGEFLNYYEELAVPASQQQFTYPRLVMQKAYLKCGGAAPGPVQINVPLKEPLVPELEPKFFELGRSQHQFQIDSGRLVPVLPPDYFKDRKGLIVCGAMAGTTWQPTILALGRRLQAPVLADPLSNLRQYADEVIIDSYDAFLKRAELKAELQPDYILMLGQAPVSKRLQRFIAGQTEAECWQVDPATDYRNPGLNTSRIIQADPEALAEQLTWNNPDSSYLQKWQFWQEKMRAKLQSAEQENELFEGKIVQILQKAMPEGSRLVSANSMAIRDLDYFWRAKAKKIKVLANRGTNGIDGTVSTALGVATSGQPTVLLTGDLAFFHDLNGLLVGKTHALNLVIVLLNNNGGGIFQYLPQKGQPYFDYLFAVPHDLDFRGLEILYGLHYFKVEAYADFEAKLQQALTSPGLYLLEAATNQVRSWELHERYTIL